MKIAESHVSLASASFVSSRHEVRESLRAWVGDTRPDFEGSQTARSLPAGDKVTLSGAGKASQSAEVQAIEDSADAAEKDPKVQLIKSLVEFLTGKKIRLLDASDMAVSAKATAQMQQAASQAQPQAAADASPRAGYGIEYDYHESYSETASMSFQAVGTIRTADGKEIQFDLSLTMQRSFSMETNTRYREGDARVTDPLVINFSGNATQLTDQRFVFDLDADGDQENMQFVQGGGFLALDRNSDGKINNGSELFGPSTGNGFAELAALDDDGNGWIDENDAAFEQLRIYSKDASGADVVTNLKQSGVGALYLGNVSSPFDIKDANNSLQAQVRSSGVWLSESGNVGSIQQIDLVV